MPRRRRGKGAVHLFPGDRGRPRASTVVTRGVSASVGTRQAPKKKASGSFIRRLSEPSSLASGCDASEKRASRSDARWLGSSARPRRVRRASPAGAGGWSSARRHAARCRTSAQPRRVTVGSAGSRDHGQSTAAGRCRAGRRAGRSRQDRGAAGAPSVATTRVSAKVSAGFESSTIGVRGAQLSKMNLTPHSYFTTDTISPTHKPMTRGSERDGLTGD